MLEHFAKDAPSAEIMAALDRDGATIVDDFLDSTRVDALALDLQPHLDAAPWCDVSGGAGLPDEFFGLRTKRLHGLLGRSKHFADLIVEPLLLAMCDRFLAANSHDYRVSTGELMALGGGEDDQVVHRDADSWHFFRSPRPEILVSANVALTEFREDNGATVVVPGSHRWQRDRKPEAHEKDRAVMRRGSVLLYSGDVLHGGGANRTDAVRIGLYVGYILSWLRPIENHLVTSGLDALRNADPRAQRLLDYTDAGYTVIA